MAIAGIADVVGKRLNNRYLVEEVIGSGASSLVVAAVDMKSSESVAIKILHPGLKHDAQFLRRFLAEARAAASLNHPNLLRVLDWGVDEHEQPFLVTELFKGGTLRSMLDFVPTLDESQTLFVAIQAARGLQFAHSKNFVHRDIKPANLLFDDRGGLVVADFGLARALSEAQWTEPIGSVLGTARYVSPEQVQGATLSGKSDVYSLSLVIYECLTGEVPFSKETNIATMTSRLNSLVPDDDRLGIYVDLIRSSSHYDPTQRCTSTEMVKMLEKIAKKLDPPTSLPLVPFGFGARLKLNDPPTLIARDDLTEINISPLAIKDGLKYDDDTNLALNSSDGSEAEQSDSNQNSETLEALKSGPAWGKVGPPKLREYKKKRKWPLFVAATVMLAVFALVGYETENYVVYSQTVPRLDGKNVSVINIALGADLLDGKIAGYEYSNNVPAGDVIKQSILPGVKVKKHTVISYYVSEGKFPVEIPPLKSGETATQYENSLKLAGFSWKVVMEYSETVTQNEVISITPSTGKFQPGYTFSLIVSNGPSPRTIPSNLLGESQSVAQSQLASLGLVTSLTSSYSNTVPSGDVISTTPPVGVQVSKGSTVTLNISKGPQMVLVPNLSGYSLSNASQILTNDGLNIIATYGPGGPNAILFTTDPVPGTYVKVGSPIVLYSQG